MLLNSGVGSLWNHEHEFSTRTQLQTNNDTPRRSPLRRSALSHPPPRRYTFHEDSQSPTPQSAITSPDNVPRIKEPVVRFREIEQDIMSEDGGSIANSEGSITTASGNNRRRRSLRRSTTYQLAHPAPTLTQKQWLLQIRPKVLLQLQCLSAGSRPRPALDILPSTIVVPRLMKRFPRMFRGTSGLGCNDVIIVKSEEYGFESGLEESDSDEEGIARRDLVAVVCQMRRDLGGAQGKAEIVLSDGSIWIASPMPSGLYEFVTTNERGETITARWVRRSTKRQSADVSNAANISPNIKFTFSIINPNSRRHPIIATLTQNKLDISDTFTSTSPSAGMHPPTLHVSPGGENSGWDEDSLMERSTHAVDESLKTLIQVTSTWVALRQGWSPYFKYNDAMAIPYSQTSATGRTRSSSLTPESTRPQVAGSPSSTPESHNSALGAVLNGKKRRSSMRASPTSSTIPHCPPKRSLSTGTAFVQRAAARRAGPAPIASDSEGESSMGASTIPENGNEPSHMMTPECLKLPSSSTTTPDTPTRPSRRVQSAYIPTSTLQNGFTNSSSELDGSIVYATKQRNEPAVKIRVGRWKQFTDFLRRKHRNIIK